jgi:hypothetical protein
MEKILSTEDFIIQEDLIDEIILTIVPRVLGTGIPLGLSLKVLISGPKKR